MKILLVEDDWVEREMALDDIRALLPRAEVTALMNAGEMLLKVQEGSDLGGVDVVVMEHHLPLWAIGESEEEWDQAVGNLERDFPEVIREWDGQLAGERLVRYMRSIGILIPVLFHTYTQESHIAEDVRRMSKVFYCCKLLEREHLPEAITAAVQAR